MLRRLRSLYSGIRPRQVSDEAHLKYYGSLTPRDIEREKNRREVNTILSRLPLH